ncbi:hypothetical protein Sango_2388800 [Sesamum angolense]|uniref:Localized to the inner membrane of the chloroplast n=1 Tax=Sesamum angolense TaxID=2727404 RepID=A0AAE1W6V4_9LAMI|nr:hypothetical protein Sango_2388800 [Sesamum angolense]
MTALSNSVVISKGPGIGFLSVRSSDCSLSFLPLDFGDTGKLYLQNPCWSSTLVSDIQFREQRTQFFFEVSRSMCRADQPGLQCQGQQEIVHQRRVLTVQASYSDSGRPSSASIFVGGFVLGGLIVGTLGCVYAPQISNALAGADKKDLMKKLPKFIYDEEKALEKQRKKLAEKIEQLNNAIDNVSNQLRSEDPPNGAAVSSDDIEALI